MGRLAHHLILLEDQLGFEIEVEEAVNAALSEESFDVLEFVKGTNTPEDKVKLYTDADAAQKILKFYEAEQAEQEQDSSDWSLDEALPNEVEEQLSEEELTELHERLLDSQLIFEVKGLAPKALEAVEKHLQATTGYTDGGDNTEYNKALDLKVVADSIKSVTNRKGQVDRSKWTPERVEEFLVELYPSEKGKLFVGVGSINYVGAVFDKAANADF